MVVRKLWFGALMLGVGAVFTWALAGAMERRATLDAPAYAPAAPSAASSGKRTNEEWMF